MYNPSAFGLWLYHIGTFEIYDVKIPLFVTLYFVWRNIQYSIVVIMLWGFVQLNNKEAHFYAKYNERRLWNEQKNVENYKPN